MRLGLSIIFLTLVVSLAVGDMRASVTYTYVGNPFTSASGAYTTSMRVTGSFDTLIPLAPGLENRDVRASVLSYSFADGIQTLTDANSVLVSFRISTDSDGGITQWQITLWESPLTGSTGGTVRGIETNFDPGSVTDAGFTGGTCLSVLNGQCDRASRTPGDEGTLVSADSGDAGSWSASMGLAPQVYRYSGRNFTTATGPYTTSLSLDGSFVLTAPLEPNLPLTDLRDFLAGYSVSDGLRTLTEGDSLPILFLLSTGPSGQIAQWSITIWSAPVATMVGLPVSGIDTSFLAMVADDLGFTSGTCQQVTDGRCSSVDAAAGPFGERAGGPSEAGSWNTSPQPRTPAVLLSYLGRNFNDVAGPYTTSMRVSAELSLVEALPANFPLTELSPFSVLSYELNDGIQTLTPSNSVLRDLIVSTDALGNISGWAITAWRTPVTDMVGGTVIGIDTSGGAGVVDRGFTGGSCVLLLGSECESANSTAGDYGQIESLDPSDAGTWTVQRLTDDLIGIPTLGTFGLMVLVGSLAALGAMRAGRNRFRV